jgi:hypothetical protein
MKNAALHSDKGRCGVSITHVFGVFLALALGTAASKRKRRGMLHRGVGFPWD